jgi:hypothetical protein
MISPWRAILARLSSPRLFRVPRSRRRAGRTLSRSLEGLESRVLLSGGTIPGLPYNDSNLSPPGLQNTTAMPNLPVFNVKSYGATGSGTTDDTVAIRNAMNAAVASGGGIIYFPAGTYAVETQPGDTPSNPLFPAIFTITTSNLVFMGAGANQSTLIGYMPGLKSPVTNWVDTGDSYSQISRFGMFQINSDNQAINNVQFRSLNVDGNAGYTGNSTVGGNTTTGDGWDMSHKGINLGGHNTINGVLVFNCTFDNWRGEEIYGGGNLIGTVNIINDDLYGTNADAVSISGNVLIANTTMGGTAAGDDIYNGVEDFALGAPQGTIIENSTIICSSNASAPHGNGIAYLGLATSALTVTNTTFENNQYGILFSETANNVTVENSTFINNVQGMIDSILGLYSQYPTGFSNFLIEGNTFNNSGSGFLSQAYSASNGPFPDLVLMNNTVTNGSVLIQGAFLGPNWAGFVVEGNTIGSGGEDATNWQGDVGLWSNTNRMSGSTPGMVVNDFASETTTTIAPDSDLVELNYNQNSGSTQLVAISSSSLASFPAGYEVTLVPGQMSNWTLQANSSWNTFSSNVAIGSGVTIRMGSNGLFSLVSAAASKLAFTQSPTTGTAGTALAPAIKVAVESSSGSVVTSDSSQVTLTIEGGVFAGGGTTVTAQAVNGVATFSSLIIDAVGTYNLLASDGSYAGASSGLINVIAGAAKQVVFTQLPSSGVAGAMLNPPVIATVEDQFGNVITTDSSTVTLTLNGGTFAGGGNTATSTADDGAAIFNDLVINSGGSYTLTASDGSLTASTSGSLSISGSVSSEQLVITRGPSGAAAGSALSPAVQVSVEQSGSVVTSDTSTVTLTLNGGVFAGGGTTVTAQAVNGVATFSSLVIDAAGAYTLSASDGSDTAATSSSFTISPGAATNLVITQTPSTATAGQALGTALKVAVEDAFGNVVTSNTSSVAVSVASGPGIVAITSTASVAAASGVATFSNLIFDTAGTYTLSVNDGSLTGATSGSFTVNPAAASALSYVQTPGSGTVGQALNPSVKVAVKDQFGNVVTSNSSTVTVAMASGPGGFANGSTTTMAAVNGIATFSNLMFGTAGTYTLSVTDGSLSGATSGNIAVSASAGAKLAITQTPTTGTAGQALGTALKVAIEDSSGNVVTANTSTVTVAVASGPGGFASGSTTSVAAVSGVATFSNLIFNTAGTYTLSISDGSLTGTTTASITVSAGAASKLVITQTPATSTAGQTLATPLKVAVEDAFGNVLTSNTSTVAAAVATGPGYAASGSATSVAASSGVATFSSLTFDTAGTYTLSVSDGSLTGATSGSFTVSPAAASKLAITQTPTTGPAGQALGTALTALVEDTFGNVVSSNSSTVALAVLSGPASFASGSTTSIAAASGVASFSNLIFNTAGTYTLSASDGSLTGATSGSFTVSPAAASKLVISQTPTNGTAGQALGTALKIAIEDSSGNVVASNTSTVTVTVASGPGSFASGSATSVAAVSGVATFSNLIFNTAGTYTLSISDGSLTGVTTATITVSPGAASKLVMTQTPASGTAGQALGTVLKVALEDAFGNVVTSNSSTVAVTVASGPGVFATGSTTSVAAINGVATFSNLVLNTAGTYTLSVSDGSLTGATSGSFTVSPAAASTLSLIQTPASGTVNQALSPSLQIAVKDQFGNVVTGNTSTITVAMASGPGGLASGSTTSVSAVNGVATFSNLMLNATGSYTLGVSDGSLTGATTSSITIGATTGAASKLAITQTPTAGTAGQALGTALTVAVEDASGNVVTGNSSTVTLTVTSGPGAFANGSTTAAAAVNGVATFSNLIFNTAGTYTISVSDGSLSGATTGTITISPAAASKLVITQSPTATGIAGQALAPSLTVALEDAFGNVATNNNSTVNVAVSAGPARLANASTTSVAAANGVATFSGLFLDAVGTYTLSVNDGSLTSANSGSITISAGAASKLFVSQTPVSTIAGQAFNPGVMVAVQDAYGNAVTSGASITLAVNSGPAGFTSGSTLSATAVNGVATFSNLNLTAAGSYTLSASASSLTSGISPSITVNSAAASKLFVSQAPASATAGQTLNPSVLVSVEDAYGNTVTSNTSTIALSVSSGPAGFASGSTTSATTVNGMATFSNLVLDTAGSYTLNAGDGALAAAKSSVTVNAAAASKLVIRQAPTSGTAGKALGTALQVAVEDQFGNVLTSNNSTVSVATNTGPASATNASTTSVAATNGVATFSNLIFNTAGTYTLKLSLGSLSTVSGNVTISAAAASKLGFIQTPATGTAGVALNPGIKVAVEDAYGNVVTTNTSKITLVVNTGPDGFASGSTTTVAAVNGVATFSKLLCNRAGSYVIGASDGTLTKAASSSITIAPAAATKLVIIQTPGSGAAGKSLSSLQVAVEDQFGDIVTSNTSSVTVTVGSGGSLASGSTIKVAAVNGIATFTNLIPATKGTYTLKVSDGSLTSATTHGITVTG